MQKLTKEQADWLIERIIQNERELILSGGSEPGVYVHLERVKQIISQCTEQEITHDEALKYSLALKLCEAQE